MGRGRSRSSMSGGPSGGHRMGHGQVHVRHHHRHRRGGVHVVVGPSILGYILFLIVGLAFAGVGIWLLCSAYAWAPTTGTCVLNEQTGIWHYSTYEYTVDGQYNRERSEEGWEFPEEIGDNVTIYYLKSNPEKITENAPDSTGGWLMTSFGLVFAVIGVGAMLSQGKKKTSSREVAQSQPVAQEAPKSQKRRCSYCGASYGGEKRNCPKCGASQNRE